MISFSDFEKVELKVGTILEAEEIEGSEKLLKFQVDLGEEKPRQILSGIKKWYKQSLPSPNGKGKPASLIGKQVLIVTNLEPRMMMGLESQGMILAVGEDKPILLKPFKKVISGSKVR